MDGSQAGEVMVQIGAMGYGSHCCVVSDDDEITRLAVTGYVRDGLAAGDRVLCVLGMRERSWLEEALTAARIELPRHEGDGSLVIADMGAVPMWQGPFSAPAAAQVMFDAIDAAVGDGFRGLRVCSDMSWAAIHPVPGEGLAEMEQLIQTGLECRAGMGLCLYDPGQFTAEQLRRCAERHALVAGPGRAGVPCLQILQTVRGLRLIGEADLTTQEQLRTALRQAADRIPGDVDVLVDLSSLAFADASAVDVLLDAGSRLGYGRRLVLRSASPTVRRVLAVLDRGRISGIRVEAAPGAVNPDSADPDAGGAR
ncbi:MEDS domain-containing protein [Streptacidiphilus cavernicola]|uniref:MEDS domain-containing protein n=1 Tax=Streptacidiphilus cavernicola TaxID=3342716 RepID=A0ABV6VZ95_9ACTN